jgi:two-component system chemotaxis response regulator CheB
METKRAIEATCPECRGPLSETRFDDLFEYRCLVGHSYSLRSVLEAHSEAQERALWAAVAVLEESVNIVDAIAPRVSPALAQRLKHQAEEKLSQAAGIRRILEVLEPFRVEVA